jgi:LysM repeat protein
MKTFVIALFAAVLIAAQVLTPASAQASAQASTCGDTYTVVRGDYLSKIAKNCGVSLSQLIAANPEIKNINIVYVGQVIRIKNDSTIPVTGVSYTVVRGDTLFKIATRYGTTVAELLRLNPSITNASVIYVGQVIKLPGTGTVPVTGRRVTLSTRSAKVGATVEVRAYSFPANTDVDFRVAKQGSGFTAVYDGRTDATGYAAANIVIPASAVVGEKWVVTVLTTSLATGVTVTSDVITIVN